MHKMKTAKTIKKSPPPILVAPLPRDLEAECQLELEICWCVQQLENALNGGKLSKKLQEDTCKNLKTLKSSTAPVVKKRQVMKAAFGDYRSKMKEEEKKLALAARQIKFTPYGEAPKKSSFVKKAAILTSGKDFKFNFNPDSSVDAPQAETDSANGNLAAGSTVTIAKDISFSSGAAFKFNFAIDDANEDNILLDKLSIKN